jgi:hypothetical protein
VGGTVERSAVADPAAEIARRDAGPGRRWVAWRTPSRDNHQTMGCFEDWTRDQPDDCACSLRKEQHGWGSSSSWTGGGDLEIYAAVRGRRVESLVLASSNCAVDAAGERVTVLEAADPARGVDLLSGLARSAPRGDGGKDLSDKALAAIAHVSARQVPAVSAALFDLAREAADPDRRGQALFWIAQTDEPRAARFLREAIERDPDREVREQGVFALSQLPDATDQLLAVIRESSDRDVRKQALFWLGQSNDPRAFAEIERVLLRR